MPLLDQGLKSYPHLRDGIVSTIYQLGYPVAKWCLDTSVKDLDLLKELTEEGSIKREAIAGHLTEIMTLYSQEGLKPMLAKEIV